MGKQAMEEKMAKLEHQIKYKQKTLANDKLISSIREFKVRKDEEKLKYHEGFMDSLTKFLQEQCKSDEQNIFKGNIQAYMSILDNVESKYNATPKLRKHRGSVNQSNMKKAILEKSSEKSS